MLKLAFVLLGFSAVGVKVEAQNAFKPIADSLLNFYKYDFKNNFFKDEKEFRSFLNSFNSKKETFSTNLKRTHSPENIDLLTHELSQLEYDFRKMDLYLFLQYAINTKNEKASLLEDSIYDVMGNGRNKFKDYVKAASGQVIDKALTLPAMKEFQYYIRNIIAYKQHELSGQETEFLKPFAYLKNGQFYNKLINSIPTDTIYNNGDTLDLFNDMARWKNHPDSLVRTSGEQKLFESYRTVSIPLGYQYIQMIQGLNAFSASKKFKDLADEICFKLSIPETTLKTIFSSLEQKALLFANAGSENHQEVTRYSITSATTILLKSFEQLGKDYYREAERLLNPKNGRLDIVGGPDRLRLQGAASVYPVNVSTFFAGGYEGYYIDLMLLAHEAGHAIQASLMYGNKVSLLNSSGPGYFTESFGKFNELLVSYYLYQNTSEAEPKSFYKAKYIERLLGLFGSAEEAVIEYNLVKGISAGKIASPADLDSTTYAAGNKYSDYSKAPWQKGLWMLLETNFTAPLHNVNDMLASLLAIQYFKQFLLNNKGFSERYSRYLKNGYTDTPAKLLKAFMDIDLNSLELCAEAISFIKSAL